ncbi:MAG: hypothetical protein IKX22_06565 [Prevotella sp.]|nr:hypothetical protein [Prevotella sp.]
MRRRLTDRQVTYIGIILGILITGGIGGLWYAVRQVSDNQAQEVFEKDSLREASKLRMVAEYAAEQALQDSIVEFERTHSAQAIAHRMQVIVSQELKKSSIKPYDPRYRTASFQELLQQCKTFDRDSAKKGWHFYDIPFYEYIPKKEVIGCEISRVYYVTNTTASADVRYDLNNDSIPSKSAVYRLVYVNDEWMVDDCIIDQESERESLRWYMDGYYFIEHPDTTQVDSVSSDERQVTSDERRVSSDTKKSDVKKSDSKPKTESKGQGTGSKEQASKKSETKKSDTKKSDSKPKTESKGQGTGSKEQASKKSDTKKIDTKKSDSKPKTESKGQGTGSKEQASKKSDTKKTDTKKSDSKPKTESKGQGTGSKEQASKKSDSKKTETKKSDSKPKTTTKK